MCTTCIHLHGILEHTKLIFDGGNHQSVFLGVGVDWEGAAQVKASAWNAGDPGSIPGSGRSPGEGNGNPLRYSCQENSMDKGALRATESWTRLSGRYHLYSRQAGVRPLLTFHLEPQLSFTLLPSKLLCEPSITALLKLVAKSVSHLFFSQHI